MPPRWCPRRRPYPEVEELADNIEEVRSRCDAISKQLEMVEILDLKRLHVSYNLLSLKVSQQAPALNALMDTLNASCRATGTAAAARWRRGS